MPAKEVVKIRTLSHSDVANSAPARAYQTALTERQLGEALVTRLRQAKGQVQLTNFQEEWQSTDSGMQLELSVELTATEPAA